MLDAGGELYLDLLMKTLTRSLFEDSDEIAGALTGMGRSSWKQKVGQRIGPSLHRLGYELVRKRPYDPHARENGLDWPARAESMVGLRRLRNVKECIDRVIADQVPGDLIETGVWRGGTTIFMRGCLKAHGETARTVWVADSFRGLPPPDPHRYPADTGAHFDRFDELAVSVEQVRDNFRRYDLLDERVRFLVGWFKDTLPTAPIEQLAVLRLDGDLYESTMQALDALYPKLSAGGFCIIDDYGSVSSCKAAVQEFRDRHNINDEIRDIDGSGAYWRAGT